jgi:hypothetical protein
VSDTVSIEPLVFISFNFFSEMMEQMLSSNQEKIDCHYIPVVDIRYTEGHCYTNYVNSFCSRLYCMTIILSFVFSHSFLKTKSHQCTNTCNESS